MMINVMLVCEYGISTSLMEDALKKEIKKRDIDMHIQAYSITDVSKYIDKMDYILLGPQVGFRKGELLKKYPNKNLSRDKRTLIYKSLDTKIENLIIKKLSDKQINDAKKYIKVLKMNL